MKWIAFVVASILTGYLIFCSFFMSAPYEPTTRERLVGNERFTDYVDETGSVTTHPKKRFATMVQRLDESGDPVEEYYLDEEGRRTERYGGYYGIRRVFMNGRCVELTYLDEDGAPTCTTMGYARIDQSYNARGKVIELRYYDEKGRPASVKAGHYGERSEWSDSGARSRAVCLDAEGRPAVNEKGYGAIEREYNASGKVLVERYYDLSGKSVDLGSGQHGFRRVYRDGHYLKSIPLDEQGRDLSTFSLALSYHPWSVCVGALALTTLFVFLGRRTGTAVLAAYVLFVFYMTLLGRESGHLRANFELFWSYRHFFDVYHPRLDAHYNIWLFMPFGAGLRAITHRRRALLWAVVLTIFVETAQYFSGLGLCELDDAVGNSLGAVLGWGCCSALRSIVSFLRDRFRSSKVSPSER